MAQRLANNLPMAYTADSTLQFTLSDNCNIEEAKQTGITTELVDSEGNAPAVFNVKPAMFPRNGLDLLVDNADGSYRGAYELTCSVGLSATPLKYTFNYDSEVIPISETFSGIENAPDWFFNLPFHGFLGLNSAGEWNSDIAYLTPLYMIYADVGTISGHLPVVKATCIQSSTKTLRDASIAFETYDSDYLGAQLLLKTIII